MRTNASSDDVGEQTSFYTASSSCVPRAGAEPKAERMYAIQVTRFLCPLGAKLGALPRGEMSIT